MNKLRIWQAISGMLLGVCLWLFYIQIDTSVTVNHLEQGVEYCKSTNKLMSKIIEVKFNGMIRSDFLKFFKNNFENSLIKEDMDDVQVISVDDLYFKFEKDKLKEVSTDSL